MEELKRKIQKKIKKAISDHKESLEAFDHYRDELGGDENASVSELIEYADIDSDDFNIGYEQGFISGMEAVLKLID